MKNKYWILTILASVVAVVGLMVFFLLDPMVKHIEAVEVERNETSLHLEDHKTKLAMVEKEKKDAQDNFSRCTEIIRAYEAELDTIRPKMVFADSLIAVNLALQTQLATAQAAVKKPGATAEASKGKPVVDDTTKTITYLASDSTLVSSMAPSGYTLIKKPR